MKQVSKYLLLACLTVLIFYGGAGVNLITYCCEGCSDAGIKAVATGNCCSTHRDHNQNKGIYINDFVISRDHQCGIERIEFDWTSGQGDRFPSLSPVLLDLFPGISANCLLPVPLYQTSDIIERYSPPPIIHPRDALSLLGILLI